MSFTAVKSKLKTYIYSSNDIELLAQREKRK